MTRRPPPDRMPCLSERVVFHGHAWVVSIVVDGAGRPLEFSVNPEDAGKLAHSALGLLVQDAAVLASYALQVCRDGDMPLEAMAARLGRAAAEPGAETPVGERDADGRFPASPIGYLLERGAALERDALAAAPPPPRRRLRDLLTRRRRP